MNEEIIDNPKLSLEDLEVLKKLEIEPDILAIHRSKTFIGEKRYTDGSYICIHAEALPSVFWDIEIRDTEKRKHIISNLSKRRLNNDCHVK